MEKMLNVKGKLIQSIIYKGKALKPSNKELDFVMSEKDFAFYKTCFDVKEATEVLPKTEEMDEIVDEGVGMHSSDETVLGEQQAELQHIAAAKPKGRPPKAK